MPEQKKQAVAEAFLLALTRQLISKSYRPGKQSPTVFSEPSAQQIVPSRFRIAEKARDMPSQQRPYEQRPLQQQNQQLLKNEIIDFGRLTSILSDPAVFGLECPGSNRNILVNRSGTIQATRINLTKEEIKKIIEEVSEKTRIPVVPGLFKTVLSDISFIAVISEFAGTRFVIQKRMPFRTLPLRI